MNFPVPDLGGPGAMPATPNSMIHDGDKNGSLAQPESGSPVSPPNYGIGGDRRNGSFPLGEMRGVITPPNQQGGFALGKS